MMYKYVYDVLNIRRNNLTAKKGERYWLFPNQGFELVFAKGNVNVPYFRSLPTNSERTYNTELFNSVHESDLHYQAKLHIANVKSIRVDRNITIEAYSANVEEDELGKWQGGSYKPDVIFYDINGNILCFVEIVVTHRVSKEKAEFIKNKDIDIYELKFEGNDFEKHTGVRYLPRKSETERIETFGDKREELENRLEELRIEIEREIKLNREREFSSNNDIERDNSDIFKGIRKRNSELDDTKRGIRNEIRKIETSINNLQPQYFEFTSTRKSTINRYEYEEKGGVYNECSVRTRQG